MKGRFIISTGRAGSTLLSRMVAENRKVLVLSEFLATIDYGTRLNADEVDGPRFGQILTADDDLSALIARHGRQSGEILYDGNGHPGTVTGRTPGMVRVMLPTLTSEPEALFEEIVAFAARRPVALLRTHYTALFEWLCDRLGKQCWVERSGMSIRLFPQLRATFPEARYLHLHRDGLETALSMHAHPWFRVGVWFDRFPPSAAGLEALLDSAGKDAEDLVSRLYRDPPPIAPYGEHWSDWMAYAYRDFAQLPPEHYAEMRFEDLAGDAPRMQAALAALAEFFDLPDDPGWIERAAGLVKETQKLRAPALPEDQYRALLHACRPGQVLTGRAGPGAMDEVMANLRTAWLARLGGGEA